ncbi:hypothetical protein PInf_025591 [Phytophthora infestans]|nr:hypothetical protein PInf_025591 [Phytophthora infestans]
MVVINPAGGKGNAQLTFEKEVAPMLEQANVVVETIITKKGSACDRDHGRCTAGTSMTVLWQSEAMDCCPRCCKGLMNRKDWQQAILQPLGVIPGGSGNGLSASLLSRVGERFDAINAAYSLAKGQVQELDLFTATNGDGKTMHGFLSLEWAFIADMDIKSERYRYFGDMRFLISSTLQIFGFGQTNYPGRLRYLVSKDDEPQPAKYHEMFNGETTAKPHACEKDEEESEQWVEVDGPFYMFWVTRAWGLAKLMMGIEDGSHLDVDRVQLIRTRALSVRASNSDDLMCVDGELFPAGSED